MFKLSRQLQGHEQDVRGVTHLRDNLPVLCSRDGTVRQWHPDNLGLILTTSGTNAFINCVNFTVADNLIACGGQEAIVYMLKPDEPSQEPEFALVGHQGNICSVRSLLTTNQLILSLWDGTARVWSLADFSEVHVLQGHPLAVWDAIILGEDRYVTAGADKTIRLWHQHKEVGQLVGHTDVVRSLVKIDATHIVSAANDGSIKVWNVESRQCVRTLDGHELFIYSLAYDAESKRLASAGEDRLVRLWDLGLVEPKQVITLPCVSVWCVDFDNNGDLLVGLSDNYLRVFSADPSRYATEAELIAFADAVKESTIAEQLLSQINRTDLPGYEALEKPGKLEGATIMVKSPEGNIEAHQWSGGLWTKIGDVVGATKDSQKQEYGGKQWDYVFDVDVEDGKPPLKLPYNVNENAYAAAERFLADNDLPTSYREEVVRFIEKNTAGFNIEQQLGYDRAADPYMNTQATSQPQQKSPTPLVIPSQEAIYFSDFKLEQLAKGLAKFNSLAAADVQLSPLDLDEINQALKAVHAKGSHLIDTGLYIINKWLPDAAVIGLDLIRVSLAYVPLCYDKVNQALIKVFGLSPLTMVGMMALKVLNNLANFLPIKDLEIAAAGNFIKSCDKTHKQYGAACTAYATLIYTLSSEQARSNLAFTAADEVVELGSEAAYRLLIAYGNLKHAGKAGDVPSWVSTAFTKYGSEPRFQTLKKELEALK